MFGFASTSARGLGVIKEVCCFFKTACHYFEDVVVFYLIVHIQIKNSLQILKKVVFVMPHLNQ